MLAYDRLFRPAAGSSSPLDGPSLGLFFELSLGLSAWKEYGPSRWALRNNPSSGNLHPTEGYLVLSTDINAELVAGVYHYLPHEHALERRCRFAGEVLGGGSCHRCARRHARRAFVGALARGLKYGERAFRCCQHDAGHAIGSLRLAARVLGQRLQVLPSPSDRSPQPCLASTGGTTSRAPSRSIRWTDAARPDRPRRGGYRPRRRARSRGRSGGVVWSRQPAQPGARAMAGNAERGRGCGEAEGSVRRRTAHAADLRAGGTC